MKVQSLSRYVKISPLKMRSLARNLKGMLADDALQTLKWIPSKSARLLAKTLKSAMANAENNFNLETHRLVLTEATIDEGPRMRRFQPVARGSAHPIRKRTSHIRIVLTSPDEAVENRKE